MKTKTFPQNAQITISVNGRPLDARQGESVFAALTAAGIYKLRRSDRCGQSRGAFCGMGVCFECLVTINGVPNRRACMAEVQNGMEIVIDGSNLL